MDTQALHQEILQSTADHPHMRRLYEQALQRPAMPTAVVHPASPDSLEGAVAAHRLGMMQAILVGPEHKIRDCASAAGVDISGIEIRNTEHSHQAAETAVAMVRSGEVTALMKGSIATDELLGAVLDKTRGIRTERRISHVFFLDVPSYPKPLYITDAAINIHPDLRTKKDIIINAVQLAQSMGLSLPKVAILSAVEKVKPEIPSTIDAAALCKMADRGQITGALLDGPLAIDNAINLEAANSKGIASPVAGDADILLAPDLEAGNILAKQLIYLGNAQAAGLLVGARVPIMLTSRAEKMAGRLLSCALAQALAPVPL